MSRAGRVLSRRTQGMGDRAFPGPAFRHEGGAQKRIRRHPVSGRSPMLRCPMSTRPWWLQCAAVAVLGYGSSACLSFDLQIPTSEFWDALAAELSLGDTPWSPDGQHLLLLGQANEGELMLVSLDGSPPRPMGVPGFQASWAHDGSLAILQEKALVVLNPDGTPRFTRPETLFLASWSPDGNWIALFTEKGDARLLRADGSGQVEEIEGFPIPAWLPGGDLVISSPVEIEIVSRDGRRSRSIGEGILPRASPDGRWVACTRMPEPPAPEVWILATDGSSSRRIAAGLFPHWSPDGERLLFTHVQEDPSGTHGTFTSLHTIRTDGSDERHLAAHALAGRWSPDGSQVAFLRGDPLGSDPSVELCVASAEGGSLLASWPCWQRPSIDP